MSEIDRIAYRVAAKDKAWTVLPIILADTKTGEIVDVSKFTADIFGYQVDELIGNAVEMLLPEPLRTAHAMWRQDAAVPVTRLMGLGRQIRGRRKNGEIFPVHVGLTEVDVDGRSIGIAFVIDLTGIVQQAQVPQ